MSQLATHHDVHPFASMVRMEHRPVTLFTSLCLFQGLYYLLTGLWPLISIETFQMVTGPKTDHLVTGREADHWLVMTVGVIIACIGTTLLVAAWRRQETIEMIVLAIACALGLTAIDVIYVVRGVLSPIYLADAAAELVLIAAWIVALLRLSHASRTEYGSRSALAR